MGESVNNYFWAEGVCLADGAAGYCGGMIRRDYILRMIEQVGQILSRISGQVAARDFAGAGGELDKAMLELLAIDAEGVGKLSETELVAKLSLDGPTQFLREKTLLLTALLQEAGRLRVAEGREEGGQECWLKALNLLLTIKLQDADFEFPEFVPKIDLLRDELREADLPEQTLAALWRHYERVGAFARAEDSLALLLEAEPDNAAMREEAKLFYERLLRESDAALESGNLPRAEVEAGLAGLPEQA